MEKNGRKRERKEKKPRNQRKYIKVINLFIVNLISF